MFKTSWRVICTKFGERNGTALSMFAQGSKNDALRQIVTCAAFLGDVEKEKGEVNPVHTMKVYGRAVHIMTSALDEKTGTNFNVQLGVTRRPLCMKSTCCIVRLHYPWKKNNHTHSPYICS